MTELSGSTEGAAAEPALPSDGQPAGDQPGGAAPGEVNRQERRPTLPGVQSNNDGDPWIVSPRQRDDRGRFIAAPGEEGDGELVADAPVADAEELSAPGEAAKPVEATKAKPAAAPVPPPVVLPPGTPEVPSKFRFAGQEYATQAEAEQSHRSMQGMFRHLKDSNSELTSSRDQYKAAYEAWKQRAESGSPGSAGGNSGSGSQPGAGASTAPAAAAPSDPIDGIDFGTYEAILMQGDVKAASRFLVEQTLKLARETMMPELRSEIEPALAPIEQARQREAVSNAASQTIEAVASLELPNGQPAFPELTDHAQLVEIGKVWQSHEGNPGEILTPKGLMKAVAMYRMTRGWQTQLAPPPAVAAPAVPAAPRVIPPSPSAEPSGRVPPNRGRSDLRSPEHKALARALDNPDFGDHKLGFSKNRSDRPMY